MKSYSKKSRRAQKTTPKPASGISPTVGLNAGTPTDESTTRQFTGTFADMEAMVDRIRAERGGAEPTFTLAEVRRAFGWNYSTDGADPLDVACDVIDDVKRTLFLATVADVQDDGSSVEDVLINAFYRCEAALIVLNKFRPCVLAKAEVQS